MKRPFPFFLPCISLVAIILLGASVCPEAFAGQVPIPVQPGLDRDYGKLPLHFEPNYGQTDGNVRFLARGAGYALFLTPKEAVLVLTHARTGPGERISGASPSPAGGPPAKGNETSVLRMQVAGASPDASVTGLGKLPGRAHYFKGNDPTRWHKNIPLYEAVRYAGILPGIDLVYYGGDGRIEYDFRVSPGGDPGAIKLQVECQEDIRLDSQGNLVIGAGAFEWVMHSPRIYQEQDGRQAPVEGGFVLLGDNLVGFRLGPYDTTRPLIIDPVLGYSTLLGGSQMEQGRGIAVDAQGCAYVTGNTPSSDFPTLPGAYDTTYNSNTDVFVTKLNPGGSGLVYSTYIGGGDYEWSHALVLDSGNNAYVTGYTYSFDFPTTPGVYQPVKGGGASNIPDAFVLKLSPDGSSLLISTFLGGDQDDWGEGIALDSAGNVYLTGITSSTLFPTTSSAYQTTYQGNGDAFVTKLNSSCSALVYSTFLGGAVQEYGFGIAVDASNYAYVVGRTNSDSFPTTPGAFQTTYGAGNMDAFVTKVNADGSALLYSTYLGGTGYDFGHGIVLDDQGNAYVTGGSASFDFVTTPGAYQTTNQGPIQTWEGGGDAFVAKLNATGSGLLFSTFLGGLQQDEGHGIVRDIAGNILVTGLTWSWDFPILRAVQSQHQLVAGGVNSSDAFITKLNPTASGLGYSTYLGGILYDWGHAIAVDSKGAAYIVGDTNSSDFPVSGTAFQKTLQIQDAFIAKINEGSAGVQPVLDILLDESH